MTPYIIAIDFDGCKVKPYLKTTITGILSVNLSVTPTVTVTDFMEL